MRTLISAFLALGLGFVLTGAATTGASAAQQSMPTLSLKELTSEMSPATKATYGYRHYCVRQYFKCRDRWGDGWGFKRCMKWRGCWDAYLDYRARHQYYGGCSRWREACAENWGYGNNDYYGCLRYHGCE